MKKIKQTKKIDNQEGFSALLALLITGVVLTISLSISALMVSEIRMVGSYDNSVIAYYAADAGIEDALLSVKNTGDINPTSPGNPYNNNNPPPIFTVTKTTGNNQAVGSLSQDQSAEVDIPSGANRPNTVTIQWNDTGKQYETDSSGTSRCAVEWTLITYQVNADGSITLPENSNQNAGIDKGYYNGNGNQSSYDWDTLGDKPSGWHVYFETTGITLVSGNSPNTITINLKSDQTLAHKLRFKCLACTDACKGAFSYSLSYSISGDKGQVNFNAITIGSTGTKNNVQRKVTVDISNPKKLIGIFDYVLYSEEAVSKPSL